MNAPVRYFGGKGSMIDTLIAYFPFAEEYDTFLDAYGGSGVALLNKPRTTVEIYNDLDRNVYSLFKVLQDGSLFEEFYRKAQLALYDEWTSDEYRRSLRGDLELVERAFRFWYVGRTRRGGGQGGFLFNVMPRRRMSKSVSDFLSTVDGLPALHARLSNVIVRNRDAIGLIQRCDRARTFIYLDPPYVHSTRTAVRYNVDADDDHHKQLVYTLNNTSRAMVALSGYENPLYAELQGFKRHEFTVNTLTGSNERKTKTESLWLNYTPPTDRRLL